METSEKKELETTYYPNGKLKSKGNIKNRKLDGPWIGYSYGGKIVDEGNYKDGQRDGLWKSYHENGELRR